MGDAIAAHAAELAETEVRKNGKLWVEMFGQLNYLPRWFHYYGRLAAKLERSVLPLDKKGFFAYTRKEPIGATAMITPLELAAPPAAWKLAPPAAPW